MIPVALCVLALLTTYFASRRTLGLGILTLMTWGYAFGIVRANYLSTASYFIFDAAVLGLYLAQNWLRPGAFQNAGSLRIWAVLLMAWPVLVFFLPFQPWLISLVGLRGAIMFIPILLLGSQMQDKDLRQLAVGLSVLNIVALFFATSEYVLGLTRFYPVNAATLIIYGSHDVGSGFYRIPAIFANAHLYGATMVATIPYLIGFWEQSRSRKLRLLAVMGMAAALVGVLMSATRLNFVIGCALLAVTAFSGRLKMSRRIIFAVIIVIIAVVALRNERFQRFKSLSDTERVEERLSGSVNRAFFEILVEYPTGNGLGGGGTSIPYFLEGQVRNPIGMESEYARILCEQGIVGLGIWIGFILWFLSHARVLFATGPWISCRRLVWSVSVLALGTGMIGTGLLTAVPHTSLLLLGIGWSATPMFAQARAERVRWVESSYVAHARS